MHACRLLTRTLVFPEVQGSHSCPVFPLEPPLPTNALCLPSCTHHYLFVFCMFFFSLLLSSKIKIHHFFFISSVPSSRACPRIRYRYVRTPVMRHATVAYHNTDGLAYQFETGTSRGGAECATCLPRAGVTFSLPYPTTPTSPPCTLRIHHETLTPTVN